MADLANCSVPLDSLSRTVPQGTRGASLLASLADRNVPLPRATWAVKVIYLNVHEPHPSLSSARCSDRTLEWTQQLAGFLESTLAQLGNAVADRRWQYAVRLLLWNVEQGLLDTLAICQWIITKMRPSSSPIALKSLISLATPLLPHLALSHHDIRQVAIAGLTPHSSGFLLQCATVAPDALCPVLSLAARPSHALPQHSLVGLETLRVVCSRRNQLPSTVRALLAPGGLRESCALSGMRMSRLRSALKPEPEQKMLWMDILDRVWSSGSLADVYCDLFKEGDPVRFICDWAVRDRGHLLHPHAPYAAATLLAWHSAHLGLNPSSIPPLQDTLFDLIDTFPVGWVEQRMELLLSCLVIHGAFSPDAYARRLITRAAFERAAGPIVDSAVNVRHRHFAERLPLYDRVAPSRRLAFQIRGAGQSDVTTPQNEMKRTSTLTSALAVLLNSLSTSHFSNIFDGSLLSSSSSPQETASVDSPRTPWTPLTPTEAPLVDPLVANPGSPTLSSLVASAAALPPCHSWRVSAWVGSALCKGAGVGIGSHELPAGFSVEQFHACIEIMESVGDLDCLAKTLLSLLDSPLYRRVFTRGPPGRSSAAVTTLSAIIDSVLQRVNTVFVATGRLHPCLGLLARHVAHCGKDIQSLTDWSGTPSLADALVGLGLSGGPPLVRLCEVWGYRQLSDVRGHGSGWDQSPLVQSTLAQIQRSYGSLSKHLNHLTHSLTAGLSCCEQGQVSDAIKGTFKPSALGRSSYSVETLVALSILLDRVVRAPDEKSRHHAVAALLYLSVAHPTEHHDALFAHHISTQVLPNATSDEASLYVDLVVELVSLGWMDFDLVLSLDGIASLSSWNEHPKSALWWLQISRNLVASVTADTAISFFIGVVRIMTSDLVLAKEASDWVDAVLGNVSARYLLYSSPSKLAQGLVDATNHVHALRVAQRVFYNQSTDDHVDGFVQHLSHESQSCLLAEWRILRGILTAPVLVDALLSKIESPRIDFILCEDPEACAHIVDKLKTHPQLMQLASYCVAALHEPLQMDLLAWVMPLVRNESEYLRVLGPLLIPLSMNSELVAWRDQLLTTLIGSVSDYSPVTRMLVFDMIDQLVTGVPWAVTECTSSASLMEALGSTAAPVSDSVLGAVRTMKAGEWKERLMRLFPRSKLDSGHDPWTEGILQTPIDTVGGLALSKGVSAEVYRPGKRVRL